MATVEQSTPVIITRTRLHGPLWYLTKWLVEDAAEMFARSSLRAFWVVLVVAAIAVIAAYITVIHKLPGIMAVNR